jgi:hypothetical protein
MSATLVCERRDELQQLFRTLLSDERRRRRDGLLGCMDDGFNSDCQGEERRR